MSRHLNREMALEAPERVSDGAGGFVTQWRTLGSLWAQVQPRAGRESAGDIGPLSRVPMAITVRGAPVGAQSRPVAGQRLREGTRVYAVQAVTEADPTGRYLKITALEEVAV